MRSYTDKLVTAWGYNRKKKTLPIIVRSGTNMTFGVIRKITTTT